MIRKKCVVFAFCGLLLIVVTVNIYFVRMIVDDSIDNNNINNNKYYTKTLPIINIKYNDNTKIKLNNRLKNNNRKIITKEIEEKIKSEMRLLPSKYFKKNNSYNLLLDRLLDELKIMPNVQKDIWSIPNINWPDAHQLLPSAAPELGTILNALRKKNIIKVDNSQVGTQLKLMLTFEGGIKALFKPQWYTRDAILNGPVYYGKDRHNAEIVAFHLSSLLGLRRVPLTVIRKLKLSEIINIATVKLKTTIFKSSNETCIYGTCHYCSVNDSVCSKNDKLEGAVILWLPEHLKLTKHRNPWQRTYKKNKYALWENDQNYCDKVKEAKTYAPQSSSRLLDLIDTSIFDFLIDNGDRHHYELMENHFHNPAVLLIDNGKSFANPDVDHIDILAPLYQCCMIHKTTWDRLKLFGGGALSESLGKLINHESTMADVLPLITDDHLSAMDRRLLTVFAVVEACLKNNNYASNVILDHR